MIKVIVNNASKFKTVTGGTVYKNGEIFYLARQNSEFTLPKGIYAADFKAVLISPVNRPFKVFKQEHFKPLPKFEVYRVSNPHKATVFYNGEVFLDHKFFDSKNELIRKAILYHEEAHQFYKDESKCDHYSKEKLLCEGYNPTQIYSAFGSTGLGKNRLCTLKKHLTK